MALFRPSRVCSDAPRFNTCLFEGEGCRPVGSHANTDEGKYQKNGKAATYRQQEYLRFSRAEQGRAEQSFAQTICAQTDNECGNCCADSPGCDDQPDI